VSSGNHLIEFEGSDGGDHTAFIDNVQVNAATIAGGQPADAGFESPAVGSARLAITSTIRALRPGSSRATPESAETAAVSRWRIPMLPRGRRWDLFSSAIPRFSQQVSLAAGTYAISFDAAQRVYYQADQQNFQVLVDNQAIGTFQPPGSTYLTYATNAFTVAAGVHTIQFKGLDTIGGDNTAFIDNVAIVSPISSPISDAGFESPASEEQLSI